MSAIWRCSCGQVEASVEPKGMRIVCYCAGCRGFVEASGKAETLDAQGGNDLVQIAPQDAVITKGQDNLAWTRMTEKGPLRWYTTCCKTPLANTLEKPGLPFLTLQTPWFEDREAFGPVKAHVNLKGALGHVEDRKGNIWRVIGSFMLRAAKSRLSGGHKKNPFFDDTGAPIQSRQQLT